MNNLHVFCDLGDLLWLWICILCNKHFDMALCERLTSRGGLHWTPRVKYFDCVPWSWHGYILHRIVTCGDWIFFWVRMKWLPAWHHKIGKHLVACYLNMSKRDHSRAVIFLFDKVVVACILCVNVVISLRCHDQLGVFFWTEVEAYLHTKLGWGIYKCYGLSIT